MKEIMFKNSVSAVLIIALAACFNSACGGSVSAKKEKTKIGSEARFETGDESRDGNFSDATDFESADYANRSENYSAETAGEESFDMSGEWRANFRANDMQCAWEATFHPNGSYSSISGCRNSPYTVYYSGSWRTLGSGAVRLQYEECAPNGCPISGETLYYRVIDRNAVQFRDRVAYRIR